LAKIEAGLGKKFFKYPFYLFGSLFVLGKLVVLFRTLQTSRKNKNTQPHTQGYENRTFFSAGNNFSLERYSF